MRRELWQLTSIIVCVLFLIQCAQTERLMGRRGNRHSSDAIPQKNDTILEEADPEKIDPLITFEPDMGFKSGQQIVNTYLTVTGISDKTRVKNLFDTLESSLPVHQKMQAFEAGKQSAIIKLAVQACSDLVDDTTARENFFPGFNFSMQVAQYNNAAKSTIAKNLINRFWGENLNNGIDAATQEQALIQLQTSLVDGGASIANTVKGTCAAVAASYPSVML